MIRLLVTIAFIAATCLGASLPHMRHAMRQRNIFPSGKIVGGAVTTVNDVPWQVGLEDRGFLFCGGSIISTNYILTSAYCTDTYVSQSPYTEVRSGSSTRGSGGNITKVASFVQNPNFERGSYDYDVSVLKLSEPLVLGPTQAAITLRSLEAVGNETAQISGWGTLFSVEDPDQPLELHAVNVPILDHALCKSFYCDITGRMFCAGEEGKGLCTGDAGGPITIGGQQVGIASYVYGCAQREFPGVYSNTADPDLKDFIITNSNNEAQYT